jgi:hypothetical protein
MVPRSWSEWLGSVVILGVVAFCAFGAGVAYKTPVINERQQQINQLTKKNQIMSEVIDSEKRKNKDLNDKLAATGRDLKDAFNAYRTIELNANDMTSVSTGHFTVGLIGPPKNEKVSINVNGTPHTVPVGETIPVGDSPVSTCRVEVKSFNMFQVTLLTSCTPAKP